MQRAWVGGVEVVSLPDGEIEMPPAQMYPGSGDRIEAYRDHLTRAGRVPMAVNCFLLRADGRVVLVDTGLGPRGTGGLRAGLASLGVQVAEVDVVVFTHLHGDHTGGNIDLETGRPLFPNARYLVPRGDWNHYGAAETRRDSFIRDVAPLKEHGCLDLVEGDHAITPSVTTVATSGHTPGHLSIALHSGEERGCILGDVVFTAVDVAEPEWRVVFDGEHAAAVRTRLAVLDRLEAEQSLVGATHLPAPGLGRFVRVGGRRRWQPLDA